MSVAVTTLKSGIHVVTDTMPHLESASLGVWVHSGSRDVRVRREIPFLVEVPATDVEIEQLRQHFPGNRNYRIAAFHLLDEISERYFRVWNQSHLRQDPSGLDFLLTR